MSIKKCGEFMEKDGVVVKRPNKKFVCPRMPDKMKMSADLVPEDKLGERVRSDIDQMNALKELRWQAKIKDEYTAMKRLYYFQQLVRFCQRTVNGILRVLPAKNVRKNQTVKEYVLCQSLVQHR